MRENEIDAVAMVREIRDEMYEETKDFTAEELMAYLKQKAAEFHASEANRLAQTGSGRSAA